MEILAFYAEQESIVLCISLLTTKMQEGKEIFYYLLMKTAIY